MSSTAIDHFPVDPDAEVSERAERDHVARLRAALADLAADPLSTSAANAVRALL